MSKTHRQQTPIAVVGVSALFPGSTDARGFWKDILDGRDLITDVPPSHWLIEDYTQGCVSQGDGTWEKLADDATCEADVLTRIHWDLQQVLVENGVAEWARPEGLGGI